MLGLVLGNREGQVIEVFLDEPFGMSDHWSINFKIAKDKDELKF